MPDQQQPSLLDLGLHTFPLLSACLCVHERGWMLEVGGLEPGYMEYCQTVNSFFNLRVQLDLKFVFFGLSQFTERDLILVQNSHLNPQVTYLLGKSDNL